MVQQGANAFLIRQHLGHRSFDSTLAYVNHPRLPACFLAHCACKSFRNVYTLLLIIQHYF